MKSYLNQSHPEGGASHWPKVMRSKDRTNTHVQPAPPAVERSGASFAHSHSAILWLVPPTIERPSASAHLACGTLSAPQAKDPKDHCFASQAKLKISCVQSGGSQVYLTGGQMAPWKSSGTTMEQCVVHRRVRKGAAPITALLAGREKNAWNWQIALNQMCGYPYPRF